MGWGRTEAILHGSENGTPVKPSDHSWENPLSRVTGLKLNTDQILAPKQTHSVANLEEFYICPLIPVVLKLRGFSEVNRSRERGARVDRSP